MVQRSSGLRVSATLERMQLDARVDFVVCMVFFLVLLLYNLVVLAHSYLIEQVGQ